MPEPIQTTTKNVNPWLIALGAFIIGILLASAWFLESRLPGAGTASPVRSTSTAATSSLATATAGILAVHDQSSGSTVFVDAVEVPAPGVWVAVQELRDGSLGNILGAARVTAPAAHVTVSLLRATVPGTAYAVVLYRDNGDKEFDAATDSVYVDFNTGERVVALFKTNL
mgnify:CR=1 FL=1